MVRNTSDRKLSGAEQRAWERMIERLEQDGDRIVDLEYDRVFSELASYRNLSREDFQHDARRNVTVLLEAFQDQRPPDPASDTEHFTMVGETRARQGVTEADLLQAWRIRQDLLRTSAHEHAPRGPSRSLLLVLMLDLILDWAGVGMVATAVAHRRVALEMATRESRQRIELLRRILLGGIAPAEVHTAVEVFSIDSTRRYRAVRARPVDDANAVELERFLAQAGGDARRAGLVARLDGDVCGFLSDVRASTAPGPIGVSPLMALHELEAGFRLASRALEIALASGHEGVLTFPEAALRAAVLADQDVADALVERYIAPVASMGATGEALLDTVEAYLRNDSHTLSTAAEIFVHVNTVRYRVNRFEELTGCSLRHTDEVVAVWWALQRRALTR